ncbi:MAG: YhdH/YhfP family quinone oxidoreductase [Nevskiales bacterium]
MSTFNALRVHQIEKKSEARLEQIALDALTPGEVVIKAAYSSVNYKDALAVTGKGRIMRKFPCVAGIDVSGTVASSSDSRFKSGDEVLVTGCNIGEEFDGGYSEYVRVSAASVVPLPAGLTLAEAMALGTAGFTAGLAVRRMLENHQRPDMGPIAVTGPSGGVGSVAIQIFSQLGYEVVALTRKAESTDYLKALGVSEVIVTTGLDLGSKPMEKARWGGAVDNVGGDLLTYLTRTVKPWGNIASIGLAASAELKTTVIPFILRGVSLLGIHSVECPMPWRRAIWDKLAGEWKPKALDKIVSQTVGLQAVPEACQKVIAGQIQGRTLVKV